MNVLIFLVCLSASVIGGICGIGGGVVIKPVIDAMGIMSVSTLNFLSGLTVLSMSIVNMIRQRNSKQIELRTGSFLVVGAVSGGLLGNTLFQAVKAAAGQDSLVGMVQSIVLAFITALTLAYSMYFRGRIRSYQVKTPLVIIFLGLLMGVLSSFLGIGGGPINLAILCFFFSMESKKAAANSLYIIMCSQIASVLLALSRHTVPDYDLKYLVLMVCGGILGGLIGSQLNKTLDNETTDRLFAGLLIVMIGICCYNARRFSMM